MNVPEIHQANHGLLTTFLELAAGEGAYLLERLERKLQMVDAQYNRSLTQYENHVLLALSTPYGIELLDDNLATCRRHLYAIFADHYYSQLEKHSGKSKRWNNIK